MKRPYRKSEMVELQDSDCVKYIIHPSEADNFNIWLELIDEYWGSDCLSLEEEKMSVSQWLTYKGYTGPNFNGAIYAEKNFDKIEFELEDTTKLLIRGIDLVEELLTWLDDTCPTDTYTRVQEWLHYAKTEANK